MAEDITLATPVQVSLGLTRFRIAFLGFDWEAATVVIRLREWTGTAYGPRMIETQYDGAVATAIMRALNKVDLSTRSLHQRVLDRLLVDGKLPSGAVGGVVD